METERFLFTEEQNKVRDFVDCYVTCHILLNNYTIDCRTTNFEKHYNMTLMFKHDLVIRTITFILQHDGSMRFCFNVRTNKFMFSAQEMRSRLIANGLKNYKRTVDSGITRYRFEVSNLEEIKSIMSIFQRHFPQERETI